MVFKPTLHKNFIHKKTKSKAHMKLLTLTAVTFMSMMNGSQALMLKADTHEEAMIQESIEAKAQYSGTLSTSISGNITAI